jgi:multidrug efflux system outer membrane protein
VLQARRTAVQLQGVQAASTVSLIRALGGGWGDAKAMDQVVSVSAAQK